MVNTGIYCLAGCVLFFGTIVCCYDLKTRLIPVWVLLATLLCAVASAALIDAPVAWVSMAGVTAIYTVGWRLGGFGLGDVLFAPAVSIIPVYLYFFRASEALRGSEEYTQFFGGSLVLLVIVMMLSVLAAGVRLVVPVGTRDGHIAHTPAMFGGALVYILVLTWTSF